MTHGTVTALNMSREAFSAMIHHDHLATPLCGVSATQLHDVRVLGQRADESADRLDAVSKVRLSCVQDKLRARWSIAA
jgi:hypothetical protein